MPEMTLHVAEANQAPLECRTPIIGNMHSGESKCASLSPRFQWAYPLVGGARERGPYANLYKEYGNKDHSEVQIQMLAASGDEVWFNLWEQEHQAPQKR